MKHKVSELEGALLDAAVAKAEGKTVIETDFGTCWIAGKVPYQPSTDWSLAGPIIERERIVPVYYGPDWWADVGVSVGPGGDVETASGRWPITGAPTYLIAAMRAYVASKLGEEVELP